MFSKRYQYYNIIVKIHRYAHHLKAYFWHSYENILTALQDLANVPIELCNYKLDLKFYYIVWKNFIFFVLPIESISLF